MVDSGKALMVLSIPADFESRLNSAKKRPADDILRGATLPLIGQAAAYMGNIVSAYNLGKEVLWPPVVLKNRAGTTQSGFTN